MKVERLFTCNVLAGPREGTLAEPTLIALLVAAILTLCLWPLLSYGRLVGVLLAAVLPLVMYWFSFNRNVVLEFIAEWHARQGYRPPVDEIQPVGLRWLPLAVAAALIVIPWPLLALPIAVAVIAATAWRVAGRNWSTVDSGWSALCECLFVYHCYPDYRFTGPGGTGGLWLARDQMGSRVSHTQMEMLPTMLGVTFAGFYFLRDGIGGAYRDPIVWGLCNAVAALALTTLPALTLAASQIKPVTEYMAKLVAPVPLGSNEWEEAAALVANSKHVSDNIALSEHLFLGWFVSAYHAAWHPFKQIGPWALQCLTPALVHYSILYGNVHFLGSTRSRKTSLGIIPLVTQIIRGHNELVRDRAGQPLCDSQGCPMWRWLEPPPILVIDLKGDLALFHTTRLEAERRGQRFHYFSLSKGHATSYFNPLTNLGIGERPAVEFVELVVNALSLFHGLSYGKSYYSKQSRDLLLATIKSAVRKPRTWEELHELLLTELNPKKHKDVFELVSSIYVLAQFPVLGPAPAGKDEIHMPSVIANREVVFFSLPARLSAISARDVAKLALFSFVTAAGDWNDRNPERRSYVFLDEAQIICSSNMSTLFQQCSGARTSMMLSNQARSDLNVPDAPTLSDTVRVNTHLKQMFTVVDPRDGEDLIRISGDRIGHLQTFVGDRSTAHEVLYPVLTQNDINFVNNDPEGSLVHVIMGDGFTQHNGVPKHIRTPYTMSRDEYESRSHTPWPAAPESNISVPGAPQTLVNTEDVEDVQSRGEQSYARLMQFFKQTALRAGRHRMNDWQD